MKKYHNKEVYQKHGRKIEVKDGFSWSVLIFGMFALIYRGMYKEAIICGWDLIKKELKKITLNLYQ